MLKVLVNANLPRAGFEELQQRFEVVFPEGDFLTPEETGLHLPEAYALVSTYSFKVTREVIDRARELKIIANYGTGTDNVDIEYATRRGIVVTNNPRAVVEPTGEFAFALMLAAARRLGENDRRLRDHTLPWGVMHNLGVTLHRKTLGIVGMGNIGQVVARYAQGAEMEILYHNRMPLPAAVERRYNARRVDFDELLRLSDFISIHAPLTGVTRHMFSTVQFEAMKPSAILINTARGPIVDERALVDALKSGKIAAAGLDVYEAEPHITPALLEMDNVVLAAHSGTSTLEARREMSYAASRNIIRFHDNNNEITRVN